MFEYIKKIKAHIDRIATTQRDAIEQAAQRVADAILEDRLIHTFGTGHSHMIGLEMFARAGGLGNVNAMIDSTALMVEGARRSAYLERLPGLAATIWENYHITAGDLMIVISNSGRNAMPLEMAMLARERGLYVIGITSLAQSKKYPSRHPSGKKLFEVVDLVIDNCVPPGDGIMRIDGNQTGASTSVSGMLIINTLVTEGLKGAAGKGVKLPVYYSQNIDGFSNEELFAKYERRLRHL